MIIHLTQTKTNFALAYQFSHNGQIYCRAEVPFQRGQMCFNVQRKNDVDRQLYFNPSDAAAGTKLADRLSFHILENNCKVGYAVGANHKTGRLFGGYPYYKLEFHGQMYALYEVGLGNNGLFLCLYQDDVLIAMAEKKKTVYNYQDIYTLYLNHQLPIMELAMLYYDVISYGDIMDISLYSYKTEIVMTSQKDLLAKYDPTFISRISAQEEHSAK